MRFTRKKWLIAIGVILVAILLIVSQTKKSVHAEIVIEASPELVWRVLMNEESYPKWNNKLVPVAGKIEVGNTLDYKLHMPSGEEIDIVMNVEALVPNKLLNQKGGVSGMFTYDHRYILTEAGNATHLTIHEDFKGMGVPFIDLSWIQPAYEGLNHSLLEYVLEMK